MFSLCMNFLTFGTNLDCRVKIYLRTSKVMDNHQIRQKITHVCLIGVQADAKKTAKTGEL